MAREELTREALVAAYRDAAWDANDLYEDVLDAVLDLIAQDAEAVGAVVIRSPRAPLGSPPPYLYADRLRSLKAGQ